MEVLAHILSRAIYIFEIHNVDPFGRMNSSESTAAIHERYGFAVFPRSLGEVNLEKGIEFLSGRLGQIAIDKLTLYSNGLVVDTRSSTEDSEAVCVDFLDEARKRLAATIVVSRRQFVNQFSFRSGMKLARMNPVLAKITETIIKELGTDLRQDFIVEPNSVKVSVDLTQVRVSPGLFAIERREDIPYSENTYFSSAPLRTKLHMQLVEEFERSLQ